jgi:tRNA (guanine37-N1)-methyltransferase
MNFHILGLFPNTFDSYFSTSLLGKARDKGLLKFEYHQLRDWSVGKAKLVDDKVYGGGSGMAFLPEVTVNAVRDLKKKHGIQKVVLTSPRGKTLTPQLARSLAESQSVLFLCGRYEGVDQRAIDLVVDEEISVGDYILSGGELAATVIVDAVARYVPGVVGKEDSVSKDSFENGLLEHPHYTRPEVFENIPVPEVLLSGNHAKITEWRRKESLRITWQRRLDLLKKVKLTPEELDYIKSLIHKIV